MTSWNKGISTAELQRQFGPWCIKFARRWEIKTKTAN